MCNWNRLAAIEELRDAVWLLDFHTGWARILAGNSLAEYDAAYHRAEADRARERVERAREALAHLMPEQKEAA